MFQEKYKEIMERYEAVVTRKNEKQIFITVSMTATNIRFLQEIIFHLSGNLI